MKTLGNPSAKQRPIAGAALAAALVVVAVWLGLLIWLVAHSDTTDAIWARWLTIMASLEAVAFAAAGAVVGTTIQHERVAEAKVRAEASDKRAAEAEAEAKAKAGDAANGRALATAVRVKGRRKASAEGFAAAEGYASPEAEAAGDQDLVAMAERLFPD